MPCQRSYIVSIFFDIHLMASTTCPHLTTASVNDNSELRRPFKNCQKLKNKLLQLTSHIGSKVAEP